MRTVLTEKIKDQKGATMPTALILLFLCCVLGNLILGMAQVCSEKTLPNIQPESKRLAAVSAVEVLREQLLSCSGVWYVDEEEKEASGLQSLLLEHMTDLVISGRDEKITTVVCFEIKDTGKGMNEEVPDIPMVWIRLSMEKKPDRVESGDERELYMEGSVYCGGMSERDKELDYTVRGYYTYREKDKILQLMLEDFVVLAP